MFVLIRGYNYPEYKDKIFSVMQNLMHKKVRKHSILEK